MYRRYMARKTSGRATAKVFTTGRSQAVRIPKEYRFACDEVLIERDGERVILTPRRKSWREYFARAARFTADYPAEIGDHSLQQREDF
jgi:antitoxin VapB